ncbi:MAG: hypothetical protein Q9198_005909, partial [Flavoplaca austrocitrina]
SRVFRFTNLTTPGIYNLDIYCREYDFEGGVVVISPNPNPNTAGAENGDGDANGMVVEVYRRLKTGGRGSRMVESGGKGEKRVEVRVLGIRAYYEERQGCMFRSSPLLLGDLWKEKDEEG